MTSIYAEANRIAPNRRKSSDGTLGDAAHRASVSDHNPDARGIVHAIDLSQSVPGAPYWEPRFAAFNVFALFWDLVARYKAATPAVRASNFGWLKYLVWFDPARGYEVIFNPSVSLDVRVNGTPKIGHTEHGHISINSGAASENDTRPIFTTHTEDDVTPADIEAVANRVVEKLWHRNPDGSHTGALAEQGKTYINDPGYIDKIAAAVAAKVKP